MRNKIKVLILAISAVFYTSCENLLNVDTYGRLTPDVVYSDPDGVNGILAGLYDAHAAHVWWWYLLPIEVNADALVMPSRPSHWEDGGIWRDLQRHKLSPSAGWPINETYNNFYKVIEQTNKFIQESQGIASEQYIGEARALRAYNYFLLFDLYRNIPLDTIRSTNEELKPQASPDVMFSFIEKELLAARSLLKDKTNASKDWYPRITWGAASGMLARLYLNSEVYTGVPRYDKCIEVCNEIISSGQYSLNSDYYKLFGVDNKNIRDEMVYFVQINPEYQQYRYLLWVQVSLDDGLGLKYKVPYTMYGGLSVEKHFFNTYNNDSSDIRFYRSTPGQVWNEQGYLSGQQYNMDGSVMVSKRRKKPIIYNHIDSLITVDYFKGVKLNKFEPDQTGTSESEPHNGHPAIRYADILLMKAECLIRLNGGPTGEADALVSQVRNRSVEPDKALSNVTLDMLFDERGKEFIQEGTRRMDQIRFGKWVNYGEFIDDVNTPFGQSSTDDINSAIWPIPQAEMDVNSKLNQNPGYN